MADGPWKQKFDARCRRLLGVTDDSLAVHIYTNTDPGGCETCGYGADEPIELSCGGSSKKYTDLGMLINDLDAVML
jgi:hypothetical protein